MYGEILEDLHCDETFEVLCGFRSIEIDWWTEKLIKNCDQVFYGLSYPSHGLNFKDRILSAKILKMKSVVNTKETVTTVILRKCPW